MIGFRESCVNEEAKLHWRYLTPQGISWRALFFSLEEEEFETIWGSSLDLDLKVAILSSHTPTVQPIARSPHVAVCLSDTKVSRRHCVLPQLFHVPSWSFVVFDVSCPNPAWQGYQKFSLTDIIDITVSRFQAQEISVAPTLLSLYVKRGCVKTNSCPRVTSFAPGQWLE